MLLRYPKRVRVLQFPAASYFQTVAIMRSSVKRNAAYLAYESRSIPSDDDAWNQAVTKALALESIEPWRRAGLYRHEHSPLNMRKFNFSRITESEDQNIVAQLPVHVRGHELSGYAEAIKLIGRVSIPSSRDGPSARY